MDGLLLDSERLVVDAFEQTVLDFGLPNLTSVAHDMIGLRSDMADKLLQVALKNHMDHATFDTRFHEHIHALFDRGIPVKSGVIEFLDLITALGLPCAIATSTKTANAERHLAKSGIADYFRSVTGGDQVDDPKPSPEIYHRAAASIGLEPNCCAAFEDSDPGTTAAFLSGATTVQVPDLKQPSKKIRDLGHVIAPDLMTGATIVGLV